VKLLGHLEMTTVDYFVPYYINEQQSEIRGIKRGWYTMDERGELCSGPFLSPSECLRRVSQPGNASMPVWLHWSYRIPIGLDLFRRLLALRAATSVSGQTA
jgi:hypothetical protein